MITLEDIKTHLVIEHNEDDKYLETLIAVATASINNYTRQDPTEVYPVQLQHAARLLVGTWYNNRESVSDKTFKELPMTFTFLLQPFIRYNR